MLLPACFAALFRLFIALAYRLRGHPRHHHYRRIQNPMPASTVRRNHPKPAWVKREVLRLKALMPHSSCRKIKDCFNRRFERSRRMTVGKTYVSKTIQKHLYEIQVLRKQIKNAKPKPVPVNWIWGMDLTGKVDAQGRLHMLLGIVDRGSRAALCLQALPNKSSWTLLGHLFLSIGQYGKPRFIRTDNESVFCSRLFRITLFAFGIGHQTTDLHCPWQNGRIERFFGTLKERLDQLSVASFEALCACRIPFLLQPCQAASVSWRGTPAKAWAGLDPHVAQFKREYWFEAWDGLLQGYYLLR